MTTDKQRLDKAKELINISCDEFAWVIHYYGMHKVDHYFVVAIIDHMRDLREWLTSSNERSDTETTQSGDGVEYIRERIEQNQEGQKGPLEDIVGFPKGIPFETPDGWFVISHAGVKEQWNPDTHSANRSVTKDGHFRRRRNVAAETQTDSAPADDPPFETEDQDPPMSPTWQTVVQHIEAATTVDDVQAFEDETRDYDFTHEQRQMIQAAAKSRIAMLEGQ